VKEWEVRGRKEKRKEGKNEVFVANLAAILDVA
jgi:hypothetical protein